VEVDELALIFGVQADPDLNDFVIVFGVHLHGLGILDCFESTRRGGMAGLSDANGPRRLISLNSAATTAAVANSMLSYS
jgi:hypothetical protein